MKPTKEELSLAMGVFREKTKAEENKRRSFIISPASLEAINNYIAFAQLHTGCRITQDLAVNKLIEIGIKEILKES